METRRWARLFVAPELIFALARGRFEVVRNAIPDDATLVRAAYDAERGDFVLIVAHPSFAPIAHADLLPILPPPIIEIVREPEPTRLREFFSRFLSYRVPFLGGPR